jgi:hypothetical protein
MTNPICAVCLKEIRPEQYLVRGSDDLTYHQSCWVAVVRDGRDAESVRASKAARS